MTIAPPQVGGSSGADPDNIPRTNPLIAAASQNPPPTPASGDSARRRRPNVWTTSRGTRRAAIRMPISFNRSYVA
jgi:hypothetical protein